MIKTHTAGTKWHTLWEQEKPDYYTNQAGFGIHQIHCINGSQRNAFKNSTTVLENAGRHQSLSPPPPHIKRSASDTVHLHLHYTINTAIHEPSSIKYNLYCILNNTVQNVTTVYKSPLIFHKNPKKTLLPSIHEIYCKLVENLVMRNILQTSWKSRYEKNMFKYPTKSEKLLVISES